MNVRSCVVFIILIIIPATYVDHCLAKVLKIKSINNFYRAVGTSSHPFSVVFFYEPTKYDNERLQDALQMFSAVSGSYLYRGGDLQFIKVNCAKDNLAGLLDDFSIASLPTIVLFRYGNLVKDRSIIPELSGYATGNDLKEFIDRYLQQDLENRIDQKAEERRWREEQAAYYWANYPPYPYWYGCYGCGGWGYGGGCCGPRFGFGFYI